MVSVILYRNGRPGIGRNNTDTSKHRKSIHPPIKIGGLLLSLYKEKLKTHEPLQAVPQPPVQKTSIVEYRALLNEKSNI